jgi:hypothetical protein
MLIRPIVSLVSTHTSFAADSIMKPMHRLTSALVCAATLGLCGIGCSARADIPEVEITQSDIEFPGVPHLPGVDPSQTVSTSFDHPNGMSLPDSLNPELHPLGASITATGTMQDLSFLESLTLTISSRAVNAPPPQVVARYERNGSAAIGNVIQLETDSDTDVLDFWQTSGTFYDVTLSGSLPAEDWAIDVTVAFSGAISVSAN